MRRKRAPKRTLLPDPVYGSTLVTKFINIIMSDGKKSTAERIVYDAIGLAAERVGSKDPLQMFNKVVENVRPLIEVRSRRVGGATYQVPMEVRPDRALSLALRWIRDYASGRKGKPMANRLAEEFVAAYKQEGGAVKRKEDTHRMAEANKAFSHYRW